MMGKTADLAVVQKTIITETERCGSLQSAVSKHITCNVDWKELIYFTLSIDNEFIYCMAFHFLK